MGYGRTPLIQPKDIRISGLDSDDITPQILNLVIEISNLLHRLCDRRFDRYVATMFYTVAYDVTCDGWLWLRGDLQTLTSIQNGDGSAVDISFVKGNPRDVPIEIKSSVVSWSYTNDADLDDISVTGTWGYGGYFKEIGTLTSDLNSGDTSSNDIGRDLYGAFLRIGSEYIIASGDLTPTTSTLPTLERGVNGTTAATHVLGTPIYQFVADGLVVNLMNRLCQYAMEQAKSPAFGTLVVGDFAVGVDLDKMANDVMQKLNATDLRFPQRMQSV